ncbi:MAG TPA: SCP2 sterol-binding domain-containing protein [Candidatus Dormibacteraeota bacterium]|nr:SCP2 sterol-binding domain-containing protein [Candidatus Dormibacteraeota bacterium]
MTDQTSADITPDQVVGEMPNYFIPEKAGNTSAGIQFDLTGDNAGKWYIKIADGQASSGKGEVETPNLTLIADSGDFVKIFTNQLDPTAAFMSGKLKVKGDMGLAIRMQSMFRRP